MLIRYEQTLELSFAHVDQTMFGGICTLALSNSSLDTVLKKSEILGPSRDHVRRGTFAYQQKDFVIM